MKKFTAILTCAAALLITLALSTCMFSRQASFDEVLQSHSVTSTKFTGHRPFYCGSDEQYDYYIVTNVYSTKYKVPTTPHLFYPSPVPFRGWGESNWYMFSLYRGRIVITTLQEKKRLYDYACKLYNTDFSHSPEWMLSQLNEWCIKNWGQDRLRIPYADGKSGEPEWRFLRTDWHTPCTPKQDELYSFEDDPRF